LSVKAWLQQKLGNAQAGCGFHFSVCNFVRQHHTLGTTPAVAAGLEEKPWSLERVVEMTADHMQRNDLNLISDDSERVPKGREHL